MSPLPVTAPPPTSPAATGATLRAVFGAHAGGVAVVTADDGAGPVGFTATSVVSVSLDPPLFAFGISNRSSSWQTLQRAEAVSAHFLDDGQSDLARRFATHGADRFGDATRWHHGPAGTPILSDAPAVITGRIRHRYPAGDHLIVVADVADAEIRWQHAPLVYHAGDYRTVGASPDPLTPGVLR